MQAVNVNPDRIHIVMTPFSQLEKSAFRGRAFANGVVDGVEGLREILLKKRRFGMNSVNKLRQYADKIPGKTLGGSIFDTDVRSADKWRAAGAGATAGAVGGTAGVGISKALRELGIYENLGLEQPEKKANNNNNTTMLERIRTSLDRR